METKQKFTAILLVGVAAAALGFAVPKLLGGAKESPAELAATQKLAEISPAAGEAKQGGKPRLSTLSAIGKPAMAGGVGAAYLTLENTGDGDALVVGASSPVAKRVEFHTHIMDSGVARMRPIPSIVVPAGSKVEMRQGGLHIMLFELVEPLESGKSYPITLSLHDGKALEAVVTVE